MGSAVSESAALRVGAVMASRMAEDVRRFSVRARSLLPARRGAAADPCHIISSRPPTASISSAPTIARRPPFIAVMRPSSDAPRSVNRLSRQHRGVLFIIDERARRRRRVRPQGFATTIVSRRVSIGQGCSRAPVGQAISGRLAGEGDCRHLAGARAKPIFSRSLVRPRDETPSIG
jgi:hypothetical protein